MGRMGSKGFRPLELFDEAGRDERVQYTMMLCHGCSPRLVGTVAWAPLHLLRGLEYPHASRVRCQPAAVYRSTPSKEKEFGLTNRR